MCLVVIVVFAQSPNTAAITVVVVDQTGAVIPGAKVVVVNPDTGFTAEGLTNNEGYYYVPYLRPGVYNVTIEALGFKKYVRDGIELRTNDQPRIDVKLEVGSIDELFETDYWGTSAREHARLLSQDLREMKGLTCLYADPNVLYRPFIDPRICVEPLHILNNEYRPKNGFVLVITCSPNRFTVPPHCYQLSAITRTLPPSNRKITMSAAYYCNQ